MSVLSRSNAANRNVRVSAVTLDSQFMFEFANWGTEPGQSTQPTAIAVGLDERVYLTDEYMQLLSVFAKDGTISHRRGEVGSSEGQWNRPSGLAFDSEGYLHVVDHLNARVQKYTADGRYISSFGAFGTGPGDFNYPWGISIDAEDCIWIVDWRNDRVQRFTPDGEFILPSDQAAPVKVSSTDPPASTSAATATYMYPTGATTASKSSIWAESIARPLSVTPHCPSGAGNSSTKTRAG